MRFFSFGDWLLSVTPLWLLAPVLSFFFIGVLFPIRNGFEKLEYNHAWSSEIGDVFLIGWVLIGATIIQRNGLATVGMVSARWTVVMLALWLIISSFDWMLTFKMRKNITEADTYHNVFIVAGMVYLLGTTLPVIWTWGSIGEKLGMAAFFLVWFGCLIFDAATGRLEQNKYQKRKGMTWIGG